ncbi:hypothetical protein LOY57_11130 [Pseudomonas moraviensis]|uniref:hypothetical protein n=1 Tax=Pseudomonas moraviensis TaxID=321662 RepID=UPI00215F25F1|nr:hypothetical protein [Pseudomonas moraviensis]UVL48316.1 hypothetical protein LOY57_11130 [Pseudomonas moraviensis]
MAYINRGSQIGNRPWDAFSPLKRVDASQIGLLSLSASALLRDELLDGISITRKDIPAHWVSEKYVHHAISLSHRIENTRFFLGPQIVATRDDIRQLSHFLVMESDALYLITTELGVIKTKLVVQEGEVRRATICLNNYSGKVSCLYCLKKSDGSYGLYLDSAELKTLSSDLDFPFMAWSQEPKGNVPMAEPSFGLITYKCRSSGKMFVRSMDVSGRVAPERELSDQLVLGGADFAIHENQVMLHVDSMFDGELIPNFAISVDQGNNFSAFSPVDLNGFKPDLVIPTSSPVARDYHGNFHIPIAVMKDGRQHLFDVHGGDAVEAMVLDGRGFGYNLLVFPKSPKATDILGKGDGVTDGIGIIATTISEGKLYISNSQAGGYHYPMERAVNHDMTQMFAFRATECCYTRAQNANMVSMDYLFLESNDDGDPLSNSLWLETWDMPLPQPELVASSVGGIAIVKIIKDAWFESGKTTFVFSDPKVNILDIKFIDGREVEIATDAANLTGMKVTFDMRNFYYWHQGSALIS